MCLEVADGHNTSASGRHGSYKYKARGRARAADGEREGGQAGLVDEGKMAGRGQR